MEELRPLDPADLLFLWERGRVLGPVERGRSLLAAAPLAGPATEATLGDAHRALLRLLATNFGDSLDVVAECGICDEMLEVRIDLQQLVEAASGGSGRNEIEVAGFRLRLRPLRAADLQAAARCEDWATARRRLGERAVVAASNGIHDVPATALPEAVFGAIAEALSEMDAASEILLDAICPVCGATSRAELDPAAILWSEISAAARRQIHDVHLLASKYGWGEREILALSPARRAAYLELIEA